MRNFLLRALLTFVELAQSSWYRQRTPRKYELFFVATKNLSFFFSEQRPNKIFLPWTVSSTWSSLPVSEDSTDTGRSWTPLKLALQDGTEKFLLHIVANWMKDPLSSDEQNARSLQLKLERMKRLIAEVSETNLFRTQRELHGKIRSVRERGGVSVVVDRAGELIVVDGKHRVAVAKALHIQSIPVAVLFVHPVAVIQRTWRKNPEKP